MITKKSTIIAIAILLSTTLHAEFYNPLSECNAQQSKIMNTKCEPLSGKAYTECERQTLKAFFECVAQDKGGAKHEK